MIKFTIPIESATKKNHGFIIHTGNPCPVCKRGMGIRLCYRQHLIRNMKKLARNICQRLIR